MALTSMIVPRAQIAVRILLGMLVMGLIVVVAMVAVAVPLDTLVMAERPEMPPLLGVVVGVVVAPVAVALEFLVKGQVVV